jgi:UDP-glucose 4-epimerase
MAALLHVTNVPPSLFARFEQINVGGTATVVDMAVKAGVKRVVLFSTIAVYGVSQGQVLTESSIPHPTTFYGQTKLDAEQIVLGAKLADGQSIGTVLRLGAIYGSRIKGNYRRFLQSLARGRFVPLGNGQNRRTLIYDEDVARAAVLALKHPAAAGQIYNVSDGCFHTLNEIVMTMCAALGRTPPRISVPVGPVRLAVGMLEDVGRLIGRQLPIGRATIDKYTEDVAVSSQRIQTELGFVPQFDLATGWRETVQAMRRRGEL